MKYLWDQSCLLCLLILPCCVICLHNRSANFEQLEPNQEMNYTRELLSRSSDRPWTTAITVRTFLQRSQIVRRSCQLPEAAFLFKQVMPANKIASVTCKDEDVMSWLTFDKPEILERPWITAVESMDDEGMIYKEAIGFEKPDKKKSRVRSREQTNDAVERPVKSRVVEDARNDKADMIFKEVLSGLQTGKRVRREAGRRQLRATAQPSGSEETQAHTGATSSTGNAQSLPGNTTKSLSHRPWQDKLWKNLRISKSATQKPTNSSWKLFRLRSQSEASNSTAPKREFKSRLKKFFSRNSLQSQPKAHPYAKSRRPHKGHDCHYHYKNHRFRKQQAFNRLKAGCFNPLKSRTTNEGSITFKADFSKCTNTRYPYVARAQQNSSTKGTTLSKTSATAVTKTGSPQVTRSGVPLLYATLIPMESTIQLKTNTATMFVDRMLAEAMSTGSTVSVNEAAEEAATETSTTAVRKKRFRKIHK